MNTEVLRSSGARGSHFQDEQSSTEGKSTRERTWLGTRQLRPKRQGQHVLCNHFVHLGLRCPYGSSSLGLKTPTTWSVQGRGRKRG